MRRRLIGFAFIALLPWASAAESDALVSQAHRVAADDPAWRDLAKGLQGLKSVTADFTENRWFPIRKTPTVLKGEARVSAEHGLSLHYREPDTETVIIDERGMLVRSKSGDTAPPADLKTAAANAALLHVMRLDLRPLAESFDIYGERNGASWKLALVPKDAGLRATLGQISIEGEGTDVRRIELRRSATQRVEILVAPPRAASAFTAEELKAYFRSP